MLGDAGALADCVLKTPVTPPSKGAAQSGVWPEFGRSTGEGLSTGCQEKAPFHCPCCRLAALHGAPQAHLLFLLLFLSKQLH